MAQVIKETDALNITLSDISSMPFPKRGFMVTPTYFSVDYVINPHMEGNVGNVDRLKAYQQWEVVRDAFRSCKVEMDEIEGQKGLPDMVFAANQSLPYELPGGKKKAIMSNMDADQRADEVPYIEQWYRQHGYEIEYLNEDKITIFEGMGDAIWHKGKRLLWGGHGFRTSAEAYDHIAKLLDVPVLTLKLVSDKFYHLDTCLCILDEKTAMVYPEAFTGEGMSRIEEVFETLIKVNEEDAEKRFACNATCPDGKNVIIQQGSEETNAQLRDAGFNVLEVDTSEFLKSGGSVYCMKMLLWQNLSDTQ